MMTLNAQGLQGKNRFKKFVRAVLEWGRKDLVHVWCVQEHRFSPEKVAERERMCTVKGLKLIASPSTATIGTDGKTYYSGGTLVIIYAPTATHLETMRPKLVSCVGCLLAEALTRRSLGDRPSRQRHSR